MRRSYLLFASLILPVAVLGSACSSKSLATTDRGGGAFGDDVIGYQNSTKARDTLTGSTSGLSAGAGGSAAAASGGASASGGLPGYGGEGGSFRAPAATLPPAAETPGFTEVVAGALSTFALDADSGSYTLARAVLTGGSLPEASTVRVEEFLNYFDFHYAPPDSSEPVSVYTELATSPWSPGRELLLLGLQGARFDLADAPPLNLVYLVDVSGSMQASNKLGLVKSGLRMLTRQLRATDHLSLVTYAGAENTVLDGASGSEQERILSAIDGLESGGSTNGEGGIVRAYDVAQKHFLEGGNNRVLLATDGDFNVGISSTEALVEFIDGYRETGVFLSVYGFGQGYDGGNYQDETLEQLANAGDGIYFFIDSEAEAKRAFEQTASGSLVTVAKDVKIQVAFNEAEVASYRLIGYENRALAAEDFENAAVDAGELGAGLCVTALYEIVRRGSTEEVPLLEHVVGSTPDETYPPLEPDDLAQVRVRYVDVESRETETMLRTVGSVASAEPPTRKFYFAAGISLLAESLRGTAPQGIDSSNTLEFLRAALPLDRDGAVHEAISLAETAFARLD